MKKTLLATAIAGAMAFSATAAQAATVYDQDGKNIDLSGRIGMAVKSDYNGNSDFVTAGSRLKLDVANQVSDDLRFFGHVEWRFTSDERDQSSGFSEVRHAWIGAESANWGTLQAGNFDNIYKLQVFQAFDYYAMSSGYGFHSPGDNGRGDAIAYLTPNLSGFQAALQAKHYSQADLSLPNQVPPVTNDLSSEVLFAGAVSYEVGGLRVAAGLTESDEEVVDPNNGEFDAGYNAGLSGTYAFNDMFSLRVGIEDQNPTEQAAYDNEQKVYGIGGLLSVSDQLTLSADYYRKDRGDDHQLDYDSDELAFGAYYRVAENVDVFTEFHDKDRKEADGDDKTFGIVGARYFF